MNNVLSDDDDNSWGGLTKRTLRLAVSESRFRVAVTTMIETI